MEEIISVKLHAQGYSVVTVGGTLSVPNAPGNRHYKAVQAWIAEGNAPEPEYTEEELLVNAKKNAISRIKAGFKDAMENGVLNSETLGIEIDNRRSATHNDKDNLQVIINLGSYPVTWKGTTDSADIPDEENALAIRAEMELDGLNKYQNKWDKELLIESTETIDDLDSIVW